MNIKKIKITDSMQKVAVDILQEFEIYLMSNNNVPLEIIDIFNKIYFKYELCDDPFTHMVCTTKDFYKNCFELDRQIMIERYGHCDGLCDCYDNYKVRSGKKNGSK